MLNTTLMMTNDTVMAGSNDDVTGKTSFGWLFATITAFGLLLFLAVSFSFYHRRLMVRRKKEAEYNRFFRFLRPDLEMFDKKITRARSILTNTHSVDSSFIHVDAENYNRGFGREGDDDGFTNSEKDNENKQKISYADWVEKRHDETKENNDHDIYLQSVIAREQVLVADMHLNAMSKEPTKDELDPTEHIKVAKSKSSAGFKYSNIQPDDKETSLHDTYIRQKKQNDVSQRKPMIKHPDINNDQSDILKRKTQMKPLKRKKKKLGLQSYIFKKSAISLDEESIDTSLFYNEPRRCSDPSLFLYNEEAADPENFKSYSNRNKIALNPYYTDVSMPMNTIERGRKSTDKDGNEIDVFKNYSFNKDLPLPSDEESHVPASTWM